MELYYGTISDQLITLNDDELHHLLRVKRAQNGDEVFITNGKGQLVSARLKNVSKQNIELELISRIKNESRRSGLHIAIAPTKNLDRMEWLIEKLTEGGVDKVSFLKCRHSERKEIKIERLQKIAIAAMKQSLQSFLPIINEMMPFENFIGAPLTVQRLICTTEAKETDLLKNIYQHQPEIIMLIGPEGDFHTDELNRARSSGYQECSLGSQRLRTETAALAGCFYYNLLNQ